MRCNGFKRAKIFFHPTKVQIVPGLQFSRSEVLDRQQQLQQQQNSYKRHSDDDTIFLRLDSAQQHAAHAHVCKYDGHRASTRAVCVVKLFSGMGDSRAERLRVLLLASNSRRYIARTYLIQPSLTSAGFQMKYTPPLNSSYMETCTW